MADSSVTDRGIWSETFQVGSRHKTKPAILVWMAGLLARCDVEAQRNSKPPDDLGPRFTCFFLAAVWNDAEMWLMIDSGLEFRNVLFVDALG